MKAGPKKVSEIILNEIELNSKPRDIEEIVLDILKNKQKEWKIDPYEKSEIWTDKVKRVLSVHRKEALSSGHQPKIDFNSSSQYMVQGACFIEPTDIESVKLQKRNRLHWLDYYEALKKLTPEKFEVLCSRVLSLLEVKNPVLTPHSIDEGIDFYGVLNLSDLINKNSKPVFPIFESSLKVWLIGQAKHYQKTKVATPDIREFVGSTNLGRSNVYSSIDSDKYNDLDIKVCDPVFMLFFTTGEISSFGWRLIKRSGVIAMDGERLATFLADKGIGVIEDGEESKFNQEQFYYWLNQ